MPRTQFTTLNLDQAKALVWLNEICQDRNLNPDGKTLVRNDGMVDLTLYNKIYALVSMIPEHHRNDSEELFMDWHDIWASKYEKPGEARKAMMTGFLEHQKGNS